MAEPPAADLPALRPDLAATAAAFGVGLHNAGLPVGPDRCERLARAVTIMNATSLAQLRACALATMVSDPAQMPVFDRVFAAVFGATEQLRGRDFSELSAAELGQLITLMREMTLAIPPRRTRRYPTPGRCSCSSTRSTGATTATEAAAWPGAQWC